MGIQKLRFTCQAVWLPNRTVKKTMPKTTMTTKTMMTRTTMTRTTTKTVGARATECLVYLR